MLLNDKLCCKPLSLGGMAVQWVRCRTCKQRVACLTPDHGLAVMLCSDCMHVLAFHAFEPITVQYVLFEARKAAAALALCWLLVWHNSRTLVSDCEATLYTD